MTRHQWQEMFYQEIFDDWYESDVETLEEFTNIAWAKYQESLSESQIEQWEYSK